LFFAIRAHALVPDLAGMVLQPALATWTAKVKQFHFLGPAATHEKKQRNAHQNWSAHDECPGGRAEVHARTLPLMAFGIKRGGLKREATQVVHKERSCPSGIS